jgi:hypothetical protein
LVVEQSDIPSQVDARAGAIEPGEAELIIEQELFNAMSTVLAAVLSEILGSSKKISRKQIFLIGERTVCLAAVLRHPGVAGRDLAHLAREMCVTKQALSLLARKLSAELGVIVSWQRSEAARANLRKAALASHAKRRKPAEVWAEQLPLLKQ